MQATLARRRFSFDRASIEVLARQLRPERIDTYYVVIGGRRFPPKQIIAEATGLDRGDFISTQARSVLQRLGFTVGRLRPPRAAVPPDPVADWMTEEGDALRPYRGRFVAVRNRIDVLFDAASPQEVVQWLRETGERATVFRVPLDPAADIGGFGW